MGFSFFSLSSEASILDRALRLELDSARQAPGGRRGHMMLPPTFILVVALCLGLHDRLAQDETDEGTCSGSGGSSRVPRF
jgi:hypothetical protein